jgi:hypothetical protein
VRVHKGNVRSIGLGRGWGGARSNTIGREACSHLLGEQSYPCGDSLRRIASDASFFTACSASHGLFSRSASQPSPVIGEGPSLGRRSLGTVGRLDQGEEPRRTSSDADHRIGECASLALPFGRDAHEAARVHRGFRRRGSVAVDSARGSWRYRWCIFDDGSYRGIATKPC